MRSYPISGDRDWPAAAVVHIAKVFAIAMVYKRADCLPIRIRLQIPPHNERERQLHPMKEMTPGMLAQSIEAEIDCLFPEMDKRYAIEVPDSRLLFFCAEQTSGALAEIDLSARRLSFNIAAAGLPESFEASIDDVMAALADQTDCAIERLSLVKEDHWSKMLVQSPDPRPYFEYRLPLIGYLRKAMRNYPDNIAYVFDDSRLTYAELDVSSDKLAYILAQRGVKKGDLVFIALDNSIELPVTYMACMKLGAVFAPADSQWPEKRFRELAESIRPKAVVTSPRGLSWSGGVLITGSINDWQSGSGTWQEETVIGADDLLYGFFTSGSTGVPKCALNTQKGVVNRFMYMDKVFGIRQGSDVILQNSNTSFDSSLWQLLWPLMSGCKIVIPRRKSYLDFDYTLQLIAKHRVTMTDFVPSVFNLLLYKVEANPRLTEMLMSVKVLIVGGEASQAKFISRFYRLCPWVSLVNTYGHTEASIGMVFYSIPQDFNESEVPVGLPIDNTYVILLDQHQRPVPPGFTAEIYVGGVCIGAGYYNDGDRNARTFLSNPFPFIPGDKLFRTGDFGRVESTGLLHYRGRNDGQIKIGGARFELSEIELHCLQFPGVEAAKILYEAESQKLMAFVVSADGGEAFKARLLQSLRDRLPAYAMPSQLFVLDAFPLTGNGKVDMVSLKRSVVAMGRRESQPFAREIRKLVRKSLEIEDVDDDANFFSLGGTSLKALKLILDIEALLEVKIDLEEVYHDLTIKRLIAAARAMEPAGEVRVSADEVKLMLADYVSLSHSIGRVPDRAMGLSQDARKKDIFLTGAGGYFGLQLLSDLLERTTAVIYCLMRDSDEGQAYERIAQKMAYYDLPRVKLTPRRVRIIPGDLSGKNWGLPDSAIEELRHSVGAVLHNAAEVDLTRKYTDLRAVNVASIKFLIEFCTSGSLVPIHYISTVSIFSEELFNHYEIVPDKILYDFDCIPTGGYNQSKWLCEKILVTARNKGLPLSIYRLGEIAPNSRTGIANERSLLTMLILGILHLKAYPGSDLPLDYFPADLAGKLIVQSVVEAGRSSDINMVNVAGVSINRVCKMITEQGIPLERLSYGDFKKRLDAAASSGLAASPFLYPLKFLLPGENGRPPAEDPMNTVFFKYLNRISDLNLSKLLGADRFKLDSLHTYIQRLVKPEHFTPAIETITI